MSRKPLPIELPDLYDERVALRIRIALLQESERDPVELALSRRQFMQLNAKILSLEKSRFDPM